MDPPQSSSCPFLVWTADRYSERCSSGRCINIDTSTMEQGLNCLGKSTDPSRTVLSETRLVWCRGGGKGRRDPLTLPEAHHDHPLGQSALVQPSRHATVLTTLVPLSCEPDSRGGSIKMSTFFVISLRLSVLASHTTAHAVTQRSSDMRSPGGQM